jgi:hypothetical protein
LVIYKFFKIVARAKSPPLEKIESTVILNTGATTDTEYQVTQIDIKKSEGVFCRNKIPPFCFA